MTYTIKKDNHSNEKNEVHCRECGQAFMRIGSKHIKKHNMTMVEYRAKYPDAPLVCQTLAAQHSMTMKHRNSNILKPSNENVEIQELDIQELELELVEEPSNDNQSITYEELKSTPEYAKENTYVIPNNDIYNVYRPKYDIIYYLKNIYGPEYVKDNHIIDIITNGRHELSYFSDIAIPRHKIAFFFPETFWHNKETIHSVNKYNDLRQHGWIVVDIKGNCPPVNDVRAKLIDLCLLK